jgi:hypothetical protein
MGGREGLAFLDVTNTAEGGVPHGFSAPTIGQVSASWRESYVLTHGRRTRMKFNVFDRCLIALLTVFVGVLAFRHAAAPDVALAQEQGAHQLYFEPGVHMLVAPDRSRQVLGKVVVDLTNGNIWGFPTTTKVPYPIDSTKDAPPLSEPIYLGKYDLAAIYATR